MTQDPCDFTGKSLGVYPVKFDNHRYCGSEDMILIFNMILQDNMVEGSCDIMARSPPQGMSPASQVWWEWALQQ